MQIHPFLNQTFQAVKQTMNRVLTPQQQQIICAVALVAFSCLATAYLALRYGCNKISLIDKTTIDAEFEKGLNDWSILENQLNPGNSFNTEKAANKIRGAYYEKQSNLDLSKLKLKSLPKKIGKLTQLQYLLLNQNQIQQLPESFGQLTQLKTLNLWGNRIQQLPESFGQLSQLQTLSLGGNQIQQLPESFGHLQQLTSIDLDHNPIHSLPMSLGQCWNLTYLGCYNTSVPEETINAILAMCQALREKEALKVLPARLKAWQTFAKQQFELSFIEGMPEKEKQTINEWLTRLERTYDFNRPLHQEKLAKSACQMLASLANSPSFKEIFFIQVLENLVACGDRAAMSFNELGIAWTCDTLNLSAISAKEKLNTLIQAAKTLTLHKSLQKRIEAEEKKQGAVIKEGVEIFLYYETHLQKTLNLLTFMSNMLYSGIGKRDWINEKNLVEEVNKNYRECLLDLPALLVLCQADPKFKADWQTIEDSLYKKIENLDPTLLGEGNYKLQADLLKQEFETQKRALMLHWVEKN